MAKGIYHKSVGAILHRSEFEAQDSHLLAHGTSFPVSPEDRQLFFRDDLGKWYIYFDGSWIDLTAQGDGIVYSKVIMKDDPVRVLSDTNRTTSLSWTDLDLTAYTSVNAKQAILMLAVATDTYGSGYGLLQVRKNGTTPAYMPSLFHPPNTGDPYVKITQHIVGMDSGQVVEYAITITGAGQYDSYIDLMGYIE